MINTTQAKELIIANSFNYKIQNIPLSKALDLVLAETIYSPSDTPPFNQSSMDGYAFSFEYWDKKSPLKVVANIQAGAIFNGTLQPNEAARIFTGAAVPAGADTVVMQEKTSVIDSRLIINDIKIKLGDNVRLRGVQTQKNGVALEKNTYLSPAALSFLAGIGVENVNVYAKPRVNIIITGEELAKNTQEISEGKVFESNSFSLIAALNQLGITPDNIDYVGDNEQLITEKISQKLETDILILTGGVSVGDYDFVVKSLENCGIEKIFHRIKQKPGKPIYFGKNKKTLVFGLPGNPASVLTCFYVYITLAISTITKKNIFINKPLLLGSPYQKNTGLTHFLKAKIKSEKVFILENQESFMMNSFAIADCLVELPEEENLFLEGDFVNIIPII